MGIVTPVAPQGVCQAVILNGAAAAAQAREQQGQQDVQGFGPEWKRGFHGGTFTRSYRMVGFMVVDWEMDSSL
jgi:hypothetical protein